MNKIKKIIILIVLFIVALICILLVFTDNIRNIRIKNKTKELINYVYTIDSGEYYYKNGVLYDSKSNIISTDYYITGEGTIEKDKYNNIVLFLTLKDGCIYKTSLGKLITKNKCTNEYDLTPRINKNNSQITFKFDNIVSEYKISDSDDFNGKWIKLNNNILVINLYEEGKHYIWFKDDNGNLSETIDFDIKCLLGEESVYDENILYCSGSVVNIDEKKWMVVEDKSSETTLMKLEALDKKFNHSESNEYRWSTSLINSYLNREFINTLDDSIKNKLLEVDICDNASGTEGCDSNDGCGGYRKETIEKYKWTCDTYTKSKVRIISYDEYSYLYDKIEDRELIYGSYWMINSYKISNGGMSVTNNGDIFVNENISNKLDVKPVITLKR